MVEELVILTEPIIAIHEEIWLIQADHIGYHGQVWSIRTSDALILENRQDGPRWVENDITCSQNT